MKIEKDRYDRTAQNILAFHEMTKILDLFALAGIDTIIIKGASLTDYYPDYDRPMGDVDLLVHDNDFSKACELLEAEGYRKNSEPKQFFNPFRSGDTGEIAYTKGFTVIDLHWELISIEWLSRLVALKTDLVWQNAVKFRYNQTKAFKLSVCDTLLHLCLHLAVHNFAHLIGYLDILRLLKCEVNFPWEDFIRRAKEYKLRSVCYFVLHTVSIELDAPVPVNVLNTMRPPLWKIWLVKIVSDPIKCYRGEISYSHPRSYLLHLVIADRTIDVLNVGLWILFPGPNWLQKRYRIESKVWSFFAIFWHPLFVISQGALGGITILKDFICEHK